MKKYQVQIKETLSEIVDIEANNEEEAIEKVEKQYNDKQIVLEPCSYKGTNFEIYKSEKEQIEYKTPFEIYDELPGRIKTHLSDFDIVNSIRSYDWKEAINPLNKDIENNLFDVIEDVWLKDEEHTSLSHIADVITEAYASGEISIEALQEANNYEILDCVNGYGDFEDLEKSLTNEEVIEE